MIGTDVKQLFVRVESGLAQVLASLASAHVGDFALIEKRLLDLVELLSRIEQAAREKPSSAMQESLLRIQATLADSRKLTSLALGTIVHQMESRGLLPAASCGSLCLEG